MGFLDALTGKIYRFNVTKAQAGRESLARLKSFYESAANRIPGHRESEHASFVHLRDALFAYDFACHSVIGNEIDGMFNGVKDNIFALDVARMTHFVATLHLATIVPKIGRAVANEADRPGESNYANLWINGACQMYAEPISFGFSLIDVSLKESGAQYCDHIEDEISRTLMCGSALASMLGGWLPVLSAIPRMAVAAIEHSAFRSLVDSELGKPLFGG